MTTRDDRCWCSHTREAHEHYRPGKDCGSCGHRVCPHFRRWSVRAAVWGAWAALCVFLRPPRPPAFP